MGILPVEASSFEEDKTIFNLFGGRGSQLSMSAAMEAAQKDPSIRLVDVRTPEEYREGHLPGSINVPMDRLRDLTSTVPDKATPVYVYCLSGARSMFAAGALRRMGYSQVSDIGAITSYRGELEV